MKKVIIIGIIAARLVCLLAYNLNLGVQIVSVAERELVFQLQIHWIYGFEGRLLDFFLAILIIYLTNRWRQQPKT